MTPLLLALAAPGPKDAPKPDPAQVRGEWVVERYLLGGKGVDRERGLTAIIDEGTMALVRDGRRKEAVGIRLDPAAAPARIDLIPPGREKEEAILGIYKVEGDTLTLCFPKGGRADRPTKFESPADTSIVLMTLKRAKKKD